jgi:hypothetical protein
MRGMGSTDMGNVSTIAPAIHPSIAVAPRDVAIHSPEFAAMAASEEGHRGLLDAAKALAMTAVDVLTDEKLRKRMEEEFRSGFDQSDIPTPCLKAGGMMMNVGTVSKAVFDAKSLSPNGEGMPSVHAGVSEISNSSDWSKMKEQQHGDASLSRLVRNKTTQAVAPGDIADACRIMRRANENGSI